MDEEYDVELVKRFMALFEGHDGAHGTHGDPVANSAKGGKLEIKTSAKTLRLPPTQDLFEQHLQGKRPLGIIPLRRDGTCLWCCIDVDRYDLDHSTLVREVESRKLPLVIDRSKSGGAHAYLFFKNAEPATDVRVKLREIALLMGWGDCEIFPKQTETLTERGDVGNWLRLPYYGTGERSGYGVRSNGLAMSLRMFVETAEANLTQLDRIRVAPRRRQTPAPPPGSNVNGFADGPPCLEHLTAEGFPEGTRNNGLFGLGVFAKKKYGDDWKDAMRQYNLQYMEPPLSDDEVDALIRNLEKNDYKYKCKDSPCVQHCNPAICRSRRFGVSGGELFPVLSGMSVLDSEPEVWFVTVDDKRIELSTRELLNYKSFQELAAGRTHQVYRMMKTNDWHDLVREASQTLTVIEMPPEVSTQGHFMELLNEFINDRYRGDTVDALWSGKPYVSEEGRVYFQLKYFTSFLERSGFRVWGRTKVANRLREVGGYKYFHSDRYGSCGAYWIALDFFVRVPDPPLPESRRDPI